MKNKFNNIVIKANIFLIVICFYLALKDLYMGGNSFGYYLTYYILLIALNKLLSFIK